VHHCDGDQVPSPKDSPMLARERARAQRRSKGLPDRERLPLDPTTTPRGVPQGIAAVTTTLWGCAAERNAYAYS
jgi:hypothetical protein